MINVSSSVSVNEDSGTLEQGKGVMLVSGNGVAGTLEGKLAVSLPDLDSGGTLIMRFNNTGFEIEDASLTEPYLDTIGIYEENNLDPDYKANLDDRFIAHFEDGLPRNKGVLISYVVRAAYAGEMRIGGAHIEHMYEPDQNGRSGSIRGIVLEK